jgi:hypothetical protein
VTKQESSVSQSPVKPKPEVPRQELKLITLIGQREKLCRDDLSAMLLSGEESLRMLIREPSDKLITFIKANLDDEDALLAGIPRYEVPKSDFEVQVLKEMKLVLKDNAKTICDLSNEEVISFESLEKSYNAMENFDYPHKEKLLEFIKYFFLDHIISADKLMINFLALKEHLMAKRGPMSPDSRTGSNIRSGRKLSVDSSNSGKDESLKNKLLATAGSDDEEKLADEERMLDIAEQCFMRISDLLHLSQKTVRQVFLKFSNPE